MPIDTYIYQMKVLVTGSTGLVGRGFQRLAKSKPEHEYYFASSKDANLCDPEACNQLYNNIRPDIVIHLAARVGGLFYNIENNRDIYLDNMKMNMNVMESSLKYNVKRTIVCLSTCIFPDCTGEMTLDDLHKGPPHGSNFGYAYAKRNLEIMCRLFNQGLENKRFFYVVPCNIYGPEDHFNDLARSHVIPALVTRFQTAQDNYETSINLPGTGTARRQFVYVDDVVRVIMRLMEQSTLSETGHVIAPPLEYSIADTAKIIARQVGFTGKILFDRDASKDGQYRKYIVSTVPHMHWMSLEDGIQETLRKRI